MSSPREAEEILDRVLSGWRKNQPKQDGDVDWLRDQASRANAALRRQAELADKLGGDAPDMDAANLHPWAWQSGSSYWNSGHVLREGGVFAVVLAAPAAGVGRRGLSARRSCCLTPDSAADITVSNGRRSGLMIHIAAISQIRLDTDGRALDKPSASSHQHKQ